MKSSVLSFYIRDSGLVHTLLKISTFNDLLGHPVYGYSFEGFILENLIDQHLGYNPYFYKTAKGQEIDLLLIKNKTILLFEIKVSTAPQVEEGFWKALEDIQEVFIPQGYTIKAYVLANVSDSYPLKIQAGLEVWVHSLENYLNLKK